MVPADADLWASHLSQHLHELLLVGWINSFDTHRAGNSWHGEDIHTFDRIVVDDFAQHNAHHFERDARLTVLQHLNHGQWRYFNLLGRVGDLQRLSFILLSTHLLLATEHASTSEAAKISEHFF